jgi:branched-chain amino acid transport system substrate-binding protein
MIGQRSSWRSSAGRRYAVSVPAAAVVVATLVLSGCTSSGKSGSTSGSSASGGGAGSSASSNSAAANTGAVTDLVAYTRGSAKAADASLKPVTLGWVNQQGGPLEFPNSTVGAQAAVKYVNTYLGGIGGHPLKLDTCYVVGNEQEGNTCGLQLVNNADVTAVLFGTVLVGDQSFQAVDAGKKPILMANSINVTDASGKNVFIFNGNPMSFFGGVAAYVHSVLKAKTVSTIYPQDSQSIGGVAALKAALASVGITLKSVGFDPSTTNLTAAALAAGAQTADVVLPLVSTPPSCVAAAKAITSLGIKAPVISLGSFCFGAPVAQGLGGSAPKWTQVASQTNVLDSSEPDVGAYLADSAKVGLGAAVQTDSNAALAWSLVMTAARFLNGGGGAQATATAIATQAGAFTGPLLLGSATVKCGTNPAAPGLCGAQMRAFQHLGGNNYKAVSDWLNPVGP